jgi:hypothetical protein
MCTQPVCFILVLPCYFSATLVCAVILYDAIDGAMPEMPQILSPRNQFDKVDLNEAEYIVRVDADWVGEPVKLCIDTRTGRIKPIE